MFHYLCLKCFESVLYKQIKSTGEDADTAVHTKKIKLKCTTFMWNRVASQPGTGDEYILHRYFFFYLKATKHKWILDLLKFHHHNQTLVHNQTAVSSSHFLDSLLMDG